MGNLVKYGEWDVADAAKAVEDAKSGGGGEFFKFEDGRNILRFLPPRVGERANVRIFQHRRVVPDLRACRRAAQDRQRG